VAEGIPADNPHFVLLFFIAQLFLRELAKCHRLVQVIPMDMSGYYGKLTLILIAVALLNCHILKKTTRNPWVRVGRPA
jgi:hypothetical protein